MRRQLVLLHEELDHICPGIAFNTWDKVRKRQVNEIALWISWLCHQVPSREFVVYKVDNEEKPKVWTKREHEGVLLKEEIAL